MNSQTARLGRLVDELLDVSRIESGKLEFRWEPVDLAELVREVAGRLQLTTSDTPSKWRSTGARKRR